MRTDISKDYSLEMCGTHDYLDAIPKSMVYFSSAILQVCIYICIYIYIVDLENFVVKNVT